jgi:hypothetical protein
LFKIWKDLKKDVAKRDRTVRVGWPGKSLNRNFHYSIRKDVKSIAEGPDNTRVAFVNLSNRHDNAWTVDEVRRVNMRPNGALRGHDKSHNAISHAASISRKEYTAGGMRLKSWSKRKLTNLFAERLSCGHETNLGSTSVIVHARDSSFFTFKSIGPMCLTCIECYTHCSKYQNREPSNLPDLLNSLFSFHQNIRDSKNKID